MSIVLTRPRVSGRHRLGAPGLMPVTVLITVVRRGFFSSWLRPGRHHRPIVRSTRQSPARNRVPAAV